MSNSKAIGKVLVFEIPHHVMAQWKLKKFDDFD